jgi:hypothetical protein
MPPWRRWIESLQSQAGRLRDEAGTASLEFITVGLILLLPVVYLVLTMSSIQGGAFAVEGAARQAVRVSVQSGSTTEAAARAERAIRFALADAGLAALEPHVTVTCSPHPDACLTRLGTVTISVAVTVPLPLFPPVLQLDVPLGVPLQAVATEQVSRFWSAE